MSGPEFLKWLMDKCKEWANGPQKHIWHATCEAHFQRIPKIEELSMVGK